MNSINIVSFGAGWQSSFLVLEAMRGKIGPIPDEIAFCDVGCEPLYVYEHLNWMREIIWKRHKKEITILSAGNLMNDIVDYCTGNKKRAATIPLRLDGSGGLIMRQCTSEYKIAPLRRWIQKIREGRHVNLLIGISSDEVERAKQSNVKYIQNTFPLIENKIRIDQIKKYFDDNGLKKPGKSACKCCPFHSDQYWMRFKKEFPSEFQEVCDFDEIIRNYPGLKSKAFLSKHLKPLREINFSYTPSLFPELIEECNGLCGI